jgi:hypothetical protein
VQRFDELRMFVASEARHCRPEPRRIRRRRVREMPRQERTPGLRREAQQSEFVTHVARGDQLREQLCIG